MTKIYHIVRAREAKLMRTEGLSSEAPDRWAGGKRCVGKHNLTEAGGRRAHGRKGLIENVEWVKGSEAAKEMENTFLCSVGTENLPLLFPLSGQSRFVPRCGACLCEEKLFRSMFSSFAHPSIHVYGAVASERIRVCTYANVGIFFHCFPWLRFLWQKCLLPGKIADAIATHKRYPNSKQSLHPTTTPSGIATTLEGRISHVQIWLRITISQSIIPILIRNK